MLFFALRGLLFFRGDGFYFFSVPYLCRFCLVICMNDYKGIDFCIVNIVRIYAKFFKRKYPPIDIDDIEQELMFFAIKSLHRFDPNRGSMEHFLRKILHSSARTIFKLYYHRPPVLTEDNFCSCDKHSFIDLDLKFIFPFLTNRCRCILTLLKHSSVSEITSIIKVSRSTVHRDISVVRKFFNTRNLSCEDASSFFNGSLNMKNISVIETMNTKELSSLEVFDLADLSDQVAKLLSHAKELKAKLDDALNLRFSETVKENLRLEHKDTGTTKFVENGFQIIAEVLKKVTWDAQKMEEIIKTIPKSHRRDYIKTTYSIDERRYANLSYEYQQLFKPARTVTPGKTKFQIKLPEEV